MKHSPVPLLVLLALLYGTAAAASATAGGILLLKSGFEDGVRITDDLNAIAGSDVPGFTWDKVPQWESSRFVYVIGRGRKASKFMDSVIEREIGPHGRESRVLRLVNKADDPDHSSTSRNEFSFFAPNPPNEYKEGYVRYWMKLQPNLAELLPSGRPTPWYMILEWKEPNARTAKSAQECQECCGARRRHEQLPDQCRPPPEGGRSGVRVDHPRRASAAVSRRGVAV